MENTENNFSEPTPNPTLKPKWFHSAWISRCTLLIAGLFFFLPFIDIKCSGNKLASIKGTDMVWGGELKPITPKAEEKVEEAAKDIIPAITDSISAGLKEVADSLSKNVDINITGDSLNLNLNSLTDSLTKGLSSIGDSIEKGLEDVKNQSAFDMMPNSMMPTDMMGAKDKKIEPNPAAIGAFAFILLALIFSFFMKRAMAITEGLLAVLAALALFLMQIQMESEIQKQMGPMSFIPITFEFTNFYWMCLLFLLLSSVFSFIRSTKPVH